MPPIAQQLSQSYSLVTEGWLPLWAGLGVFVALGWFVCHQLKREFPRTGSRRLARWVLPAIRLLIVGALIWMVCRPVVQTTQRWQVRPELLIIVSDANSMEVVEEFGNVTKKIDALDALGAASLPKRNRGASQLARALGRLTKSLDDVEQSLRDGLSEIGSGLPLGSGLARDVSRFRTSLSSILDEMATIETDLKVALEEETTQEALSSVRNVTKLLLSTAQSLDREAELAARQASAHPQLLEKLAESVRSIRSRARALQTDSQNLQSLLDATLLGEAVVGDLAKARHTRKQFAEMVADKIRDRVKDEFGVRTQYGSAMGAALTAAFMQSVSARNNAPLAGVVYIADGSQPVGDAAVRALDTLREADVPVHTVLIGADGVRPRDIGLAAVDVPSVAVAGQSVTARVLVAGGLGKDKVSTLDVRSRGEFLSSVGFFSSTGSMTVREAPLLFQQSGRYSLLFAVTAGAGDAFAGNERFAAVVDVFTHETRALIVSDRLTEELAAYGQILDTMPCVRPEVIIAEPGIGEIKLGTKPRQFPAEAEQWQGFRLALLLGGVPKGIPDSALDGLVQAVESGLHVYLQAAPTECERTWASVFGIEVTAAQSPQRVRPPKDYWLPWYSLARGEAESLARWDALPPVPRVCTVSTPGFVSLECDAGPVLCTIPRGEGLIVYNGIASLSALRDGGNEASVNRIVHGILAQALSPTQEPSTERGGAVTMFPPQPVQGKKVAIRSAAPLADLQGLTLAGDHPGGGTVYKVTGSARVSFSVDGRSFERPVHRLLGPADFEITPCAETLQQIAAATGGKHTDVVELDALLSGLQAVPAQRRSVSNCRLWTEVWPLLFVLALVSAEYLLRRRAGRVM